MKKNTIWQNIDLDIEDYNDYFQENGLENANEYNKKFVVEVLNNEYLDDERENLDIDAEIIALADIGRWNGRQKAARFYNNIKECLYTDCDYVDWYVDRYDFKMTGHHHDGTNYITYREVKPDCIDRLINILNSRPLTKNDITRYTKSLRPRIAQVYGW